MLNIQKILIRKLDDYDELLKHIPHTHIDKDVIMEIKTVIGTRCKSIIIEYPYYESDYLSTYYIFYAKKLQCFPKECWRLLFFTDRNSNDMMGCISLRPTYEGTRLGRTLIEPQYLLSKKAYMILAKQKIHFKGAEGVLKVFPHMQQDGDVAVCAHVALWSVYRSLTMRFSMYQEARLGKLVEMVQPYAEIRIPSEGLTASEIADVFFRMGLTADSSTSNNESSSPQHLDAIISYIDSGIPVIGISSTYKHAVAMIGHCGGDLKNISWKQIEINRKDLFESIEVKKDTTSIQAGCDDAEDNTTEVLFTSRLVRDIIVNDDNFLPYRVLSRTPSASETYYKEYVGVKEIRHYYKLIDFDYMVAPVYPRIQLLYDQVRTYFKGLVRTGCYNWSKKITARIFLTSANKYREYVNSNLGFKNDIRNILIHLEMPKFVWCIESATLDDYKKGLVDSIVLIDTTSATMNKKPFLFIADPNKVCYLDTAEKDKNRVEKVLRGASLKPVLHFENILEEVTPNV